jgi:AraC-like DNA-binding protein
LLAAKNWGILIALMNKGADSVPHKISAGLAYLLETSGKLTFTPQDVLKDLDARRRSELTLDREFPFHIRLIHFPPASPALGPMWHERLELLLSLDGPLPFRMGDQEVHLARGDWLVVDNLKLHQVLEFPETDTRLIVISFLPEFVYSLGSPSHDYRFLLPFYNPCAHRTHVLRADAPAANEACAAGARLLECYFGARDRLFYQAGCKAYFLELLYHLARHFRESEPMKIEFERQQRRSQRLQGLFDHLSHHYAEKITVGAAADFARMSQSQFMRAFKKVAGMTLVSYINHVRLSNAARLLRETSLSIAEISSQVGFADQSYFDKRFKASFGLPPTEYRHGL